MAFGVFVGFGLGDAEEGASAMFELPFAWVLLSNPHFFILVYFFSEGRQLGGQFDRTKLSFPHRTPLHPSQLNLQPLFIPYILKYARNLLKMLFS